MFGYPPKNNADVVIPLAPAEPLAVLTLGPSVQNEPSYCSTLAVGTSPEMAKAAVWVPAPPRLCDTVFIFPPDVQLVPSYSKVTFVFVAAPGSPPGAVWPPKITPAVNIPAPAAVYACWGVFVTEVQLVPLYSSVACVWFVGCNCPPAATAAVCIPKPAIWFLAVFILLLAVQSVPSYSSVVATFVVVLPPDIKDKSFVP